MVAPLPEIPIDAVVMPVMTAHSVPGMAVTVVTPEGVQYRAYGLADVGRGCPVTSTTVFRIASISKTITALAVMQLCEQRLIGLDDPVNEHLRQYRVEPPQGSDEITVRHILTHMSGIGDFRGPRDLLHLSTMAGLGAPVGRAIPSLHEYYAPALHGVSPPGTKWAYSNHAMATLGAMVADVVGVDFETHVQSTVLRPLGMTSTSFTRRPDLAADLAVGYRTRRGALRPVHDLNIIPVPAGSAYSTPEDLGRYAQALVNGGANDHGRVVEAVTLADMFTPQIDAPAGAGAMGLCFFLGEIAGERVAWHQGAWPGFATLLLLAPDARCAVVVCSNRWSATGSHANEVVGSTLLRQLLTAPYVRRRPLTPASSPASTNDDVIGVYTAGPGFLANARPWAMFGNRVVVSSLDGELVLRARLGPLRRGVPLRRVNDNNLTYEIDLSFKALDTFSPIDPLAPMTLVFEQGDDDRVTRLHGLGRTVLCLRRKPRRGSRTRV
jgi:CubicO group peptidase (beta-lactamase class C family)